MSPPILMYHRICRDDEYSPCEFLVTASVFREQMKYLARRGYFTPRLSEVLTWNGGAPQMQRAPVVLTFDDGYVDNFENALPILQEFGFTGAVFPVLDLSRRTTWWNGFSALSAPLMSPEQVRAMEHAGMEFGSHSLSHHSLPRLTDSELAEELTRSREVLGSIVERPLPVLAYPYGDVDRRVKRAVQRAGYSAALAVNSGPVAIDADRYEIRRVPVTNRSSDAYMKLKLSATDQLYRWMKWKVREGLHWTGRLERSPDSSQGGAQGGEP
jgi:peptidoglycan/xylan/chitin deacetylase (PgdA/CDA1 family)